MKRGMFARLKDVQIGERIPTRFVKCPQWVTKRTSERI